MSSSRRDQAVIILEGVRKAPADRTHQLWLINDAGTARSAGTVEVAESPKDVIVESGVASAATVGLTIEPAGGSQKPTTDPIAGVDLR